MVMTVQEYVDRFQACFINTDNGTFKGMPKLAAYHAAALAEYGIRSIRDAIGNEIEEAIRAVGHVPNDEEMQVIITEYNNKWNDINRLLTERTNGKWLKDDAIQSIWNRACEIVEGGDTNDS